MEDSDLGFYMWDRSSLPPVPENGGYEPSIAQDPEPEGTPVHPEGAEPLEGDRVVPYEEDHEVAVVDGVSMNMLCTLKTLQSGCTALGLSTRGGRAKCFKRMADHLRAQTLIAAHGATVKLRAESERVPIGQDKPEEPSQQEIETHNLTHEPYKPWCSLCVQYRARQDPHPVSSHAASGHSLLSMDFGYCSRKEDESDKQTCPFLHDRATKLMRAVPAPQKGARSLRHLVTEATRFVVSTQPKEVAAF
eukprot:s3208_g8.t1